MESARNARNVLSISCHVDSLLYNSVAFQEWHVRSKIVTTNTNSGITRHILLIQWFILSKLQQRLTTPRAYRLNYCRICIYDSEQIGKYQNMALKKQELIQQHVFQCESCCKISKVKAYIPPFELEISSNTCIPVWEGKRKRKNGERNTIRGD